MSMRQTTERAVRILERLVAFPSICGTSNSDIADYIAEVLRKAGAVIRTVPGPDEGRVNLLQRSATPVAPVIYSRVTLMWFPQQRPIGRLIHSRFARSMASCLRAAPQT